MAAMVDESARVIVEKSISLGHGLGLPVLAEGVETVEIWEWLKSSGCDSAQGSFISEPIPPGKTCRLVGILADPPPLTIPLVPQNSHGSWRHPHPTVV